MESLPSGKLLPNVNAFFSLSMILNKSLTLPPLFYPRPVVLLFLRWTYLLETACAVCSFSD